MIAPSAIASGPARDADLFFDRFDRGAVAADHVMASSAGAQMLELGGNAVDAAVAASFTLSVVRPYSCGIGGGGFMVIHLPDDPTHGYVHTTINYRETSPFNADLLKMGTNMRQGRYSVAVPGTVAGLLHALENYGTLDREIVLRPAIEAAINGFIVDEHYMNAAQGIIEKYQRVPAHQQNEMAMPWGKFALWGHVKVGDRIKNPEQARALQLIVDQGLEAFTTGEIGQAIERAMTPKQITKRTPVTITTEVLESYEPAEQVPMETSIHGYRFIGMAPPSSGGITMFQTLEILEAAGYDFGSTARTNESTATLIESLKHAFADRSRYLADPAFVFVPTDALMEQSNIDRIAGSIDFKRRDPESYGTQGVLPSTETDGSPLPDDGGTSHVSVIDPFGGAVAMTETINHEFGSRIGVPEFGFCLNNEMDDFTNPRKKANGFGLVQSDRNEPEIGKRPLSSMSPTIVLDPDGNVFAIAGASGGPRIITGTLQVLLNVLGGMDAGEAVARPRLHHQWMPYETHVEPGFHSIILNVFNEPLRGFNQTIASTDAVIGNVQLIVRKDDHWQAASDPRKGGRPSGLD